MMKLTWQRCLDVRWKLSVLHNGCESYLVSAREHGRGGAQSLDWQQQLLGSESVRCDRFWHAVILQATQQILQKYTGGRARLAHTDCKQTIKITTHLLPLILFRFRYKILISVNWCFLYLYYIGKFFLDSFIVNTFL